MGAQSWFPFKLESNNGILSFTGLVRRRRILSNKDAFHKSHVHDNEKSFPCVQFKSLCEIMLDFQRKTKLRENFIFSTTKGTLSLDKTVSGGVVPKKCAKLLDLLTEETASRKPCGFLPSCINE